MILNSNKKTRTIEKIFKKYFLCLDWQMANRKMILFINRYFAYHSELNLLYEQCF